MVRVVLDELDAVGIVVPLRRDHVEVLAATELVEVRPEGEGRWRLLPRGRVGAVRVGDVQVEVTPKDKVGLSQLLFYLGYAADPGFHQDTVDGTQDLDLWPALAHSLAIAVERALARGVQQGYRTTDDALRVIRGRIRFDDQIRASVGLVGASLGVVALGVYLPLSPLAGVLGFDPLPVPFFLARSIGITGPSLIPRRPKVRTSRS